MTINVDLKGDYGFDPFFNGIIKLHQESPGLAWFVVVEIFTVIIFFIFLIYRIFTNKKAISQEIDNKIKTKKR